MGFRKNEPMTTEVFERLKTRLAEVSRDLFDLDDLDPVKPAESPHSAWIEAHRDELQALPDEWVAIHETDGIMFHTSNDAALEAWQDTWPSDRRSEVLIVHKDVRVNRIDKRRGDTFDSPKTKAAVIRLIRKAGAEGVIRALSLALKDLGPEWTTGDNAAEGIEAVLGYSPFREDDWRGAARCGECMDCQEWLLCPKTAGPCGRSYANGHSY
jgi:hypothetical protein